ncbi:hypothetical protein CEXT_76831 [Caerostris extrusa]|uniref:Uncharacterized protein n=1 Tax=Caerostris extrusa TaxID=172846 RepID=A0AAV4PMI1_CAEEX|nr:hypothetical protein CEXT_76831 [Caerostris extrusa]
MFLSQRPRKPHFPLIASLPRQLPTGIGLRRRVNSRPLTEMSTLCLQSVRTREDFLDDSSPKFVSAGPRKPHFQLIASLPRQLPTGIRLRCRVNSRPLTEKSTLCLQSVRTREDFLDDSSPEFVSTVTIPDENDSSTESYTDEQGCWGLRDPGNLISRSSHRSPDNCQQGIGWRCRVNSRPLTEKSTLCLQSVRTREDFLD